jgi:hypothetical protein
VTFTPTDTTDYSSATATTTITVNKVTPTITWPAPPPCTYGTTLSVTQLNASASVPGTFAYSPAAGTVLSAGAGQTLTVTFTPIDVADYTSATRTTSLTVNKATPVVTWTAPAAITYGTALSAIQLAATANVAGTFVYNPAAGTVMPAGANQTLSVTFAPSDATDYSIATASTAITVNAAVSTQADVSSQVKVTTSGLSFSRATNAYTGTVTLTNIGSTLIAAPIQSVFTGLISGATLANQTGTAPSGPYAGAPYITVASSSALAPGASISFTVKFTYTGTAPISYVSKTLSGGF